MTPYIILIAGISASGKTTYARHIAEKLHTPFICKDAIKEKLYDVLQFETENHENSRLYGAASYSVFFHIAEQLMKADASFVMESNFTLYSAEIFSPLVQTYGYRTLTVLFDADAEILNKRFREREETDERHPGLKLPNDIQIDFTNFNCAAYRDFCVGKKITVNTTDFGTVDYNKIDALVLDFIADNPF